MGIFSSLKQWNDECNERGKVIEQQVPSCVIMKV